MRWLIPEVKVGESVVCRRSRANAKDGLFRWVKGYCPGTVTRMVTTSMHTSNH